VVGVVRGSPHPACGHLLPIRCGEGIIFQLLTPALSSFGEEREKNFVGRFPGVAAARQRRANFLYAFRVFEFTFALHPGQFIQDFLAGRFAGFSPGPGGSVAPSARHICRNASPKKFQPHRGGIIRRFSRICRS
jgi:hypothetical protein